MMKNSHMETSEKIPNISWLFYRGYFKDIDFSSLSSNETKNKNLLSDHNKKLIESKAYPMPEVKIKSSLEKVFVRVQYPGLVTGVGINHEVKIEGEFKLGVHFDYTYGMPVVYGSSVKGLLRSVFPDKKKDNDDILKCKAQMIKNYLSSIDKKSLTKEKITEWKEKCKTLDVEALCDWIFEGKEDGKSLSIYKRDIFFDAVIIEPNVKQDRNGEDIIRILASDSITPHNQSPLKNPTPITFLKIASGVIMEFRFDLESCNINGIEISSEDKKELFSKILCDFGIGAKTNVGYGQFEVTEEK